jgi:hypothetical protein
MCEREACCTGADDADVGAERVGDAVEAHG